LHFEPLEHGYGKHILAALLGHAKHLSIDEFGHWQLSLRADNGLVGLLSGHSVKLYSKMHTLVQTSQKVQKSTSSHCLDASSCIIDGFASLKDWALDRQAHSALTVVRSALVVACEAFGDI
jgi:hypothetical protein